MNKAVWRTVRFSLYFAFFLSAVLIQWIAPFQYKCNFTDEKCFACGMRTAIDRLLAGDFASAYRSNRLIVLVILAGIAVAVDVGRYFYRRNKQERTA